MFSIVTVCFNSAAVIGNAMQSLASQRDADYEWVVIDGASKDDTLARVAAFDAAPKVVVSERDKGIYDAMNKGARHARNEWVYFLNSDDRLHDATVLRDVAAAIRQDPGLDLVYGSVRYTGESTDVLHTFKHIDARSLLFEDLNHQAVFARRSLFDRVGLFNTAFKFNADYDWLIRVFQSGARTCRLDRCVADFYPGGAHAQDGDFLARERRDVRLQYLSPRALQIGTLASRVQNRLECMLIGHNRVRVPVPKVARAPADTAPPPARAT